MLNLRRLVGAWVVACAAAVAVPAVAVADEGATLAECDLSGRVCVWTEPHRGGTYGAYSLQVTAFPTSLNNNIESIYNRYSQAWMFYDGYNFAGPIFCVEPGVEVSDLNIWGLANRASSMRRTGTTYCPPGVIAFIR